MRGLFVGILESGRHSGAHGKSGGLLFLRDVQYLADDVQ